MANNLLRQNMLLAMLPKQSTMRICKYIYIYYVFAPEMPGKSLFREPFATPSPRPFVSSARSKAIVAAAVTLASPVTMAGLQQSEVKAGPNTRNLATSSPFAGLSQMLRETCSKIARPNVLLCIPFPAQAENQGRKYCASPSLQGSRVCESMPPKSCCLKTEVSFANSFADLSRARSPAVLWSFTV